MDYLLYISSKGRKITEVQRRQQEHIMNMPLLKIHIDSASKQINQTNQSLSAHETINLRIQQGDKNADEDFSHSNSAAATKKTTYTLRELFNLPADVTKDNVYEVVQSA